MDISKIIDESINKSVKDIADEKFTNSYNLPDNLNDEVKQIKMLMNYSNILLETYHKELRKELAKHGIDL